MIVTSGELTPHTLEEMRGREFVPWLLDVSDRKEQFVHTASSGLVPPVAVILNQGNT